MTEQDILKFWQENNIFEKSVKKDAPNGDFVFYDGPPFATGTPHYGHIVASAMKDVVPRYWTMRGYRVERKWGWDCHGLPIENIAEKELGIKRKKEIEEMGVAKFNEFCRSKVWGYVDEWKKVIARLGRWADMEDSYKTMDASFMESVWWVFKQLWEKGLIYEGYRSMHICTRCETTLSQQEVAEGYKDIKDLSATVKFELVESPSASSGQARTFVLAWTTTPWTLIGNVALAVGESIQYLVISIKDDENRYIVAKDRISEVFKDKEFEVVKEISGKDLVGKQYKPLFDYYIGKGIQNEENGWKIYSADFVTTEEGTGVVHIAPAFGEDDINFGKQYNLPFVQHVNMDGTIKQEAGEFAGLSVKPAQDHQSTDVGVIKNLAHKGLLFAKEKYEHSYPHCWRCDTPLINYATSSWFVAITKIKERAIELAKEINWSPSHIKEGRFGKWLEGARDWSISRQRYWASVIPVWKCEKCKEMKVVGSVEEIREGLGGLNKLFLTRHGEAENNVADILNSDLDKNHFHLTEKGKKQIEMLAENLKKEKIDIIFSSPFLRTKETAEIIAKKLEMEIIIDERLKEFGVGNFNGKTRGEFFAALPNWPDELKDDRSKFGVETESSARSRLDSFLEEINKKFKNKNIVVVAHGDIVQFLFSITQDKNRAQIYHSWCPEKGSTRVVYSRSIDLHKHIVDKVVLGCEKCGGEMRRVPDVLDTWFDSGSMPYAQVHYPFENREKFDANFPAQFIAEGVDQTRAWFYYLHAIATAIKDSQAFSNVIVNGTVLAEDGKKMSKRLNNYPNPMDVIEKYGADALRYYLLSSPVVKAENLNFSEKGVDEAHKKVVMRLKNVLAFYNMYVDSSQLSVVSSQTSENILDKWIIARLNQLIGETTDAMEKYELNEAVRPIADFVDDLSNWYVRRSRERFKGEGDDKNNAVATLRYVLIELSKLMAPFMPFVAEEVYQELVVSSQSSVVRKESVHLEEWPKVNKITGDQERIITQMYKTREWIEIILMKRMEKGIKVRQPLMDVFIPGVALEDEYKKLIMEETNIKKVGASDTENLILNTNITPELKNEGVIRELIRNIQDLRKKAGLTPQQKIELVVETGEDFVKKFGDEIKRVTNADVIEFSPNDGEEIKIDELVFKVKIRK